MNSVRREILLVPESKLWRNCCVSSVRTVRDLIKDLVQDIPLHRVVVTKKPVNEETRSLYLKQESVLVAAEQKFAHGAEHANE